MLLDFLALTSFQSKVKELDEAVKDKEILIERMNKSADAKEAQIVALR